MNWNICCVSTEHRVLFPWSSTKSSKLKNIHQAIRLPKHVTRNDAMWQEWVGFLTIYFRVYISCQLQQVYYDKMFLALVPSLLALKRIGLCLFWRTNYLLALPLVTFCHSPATSSHSHRSWCDGLGMGSPCNLVFNHQSATFSCAPRWWDIVVLLAGIAVRFVTHRDPRSPWRLPCRRLPTSLGWLRRGRSWEQKH